MWYHDTFGMMYQYSCTLYCLISQNNFLAICIPLNKLYCMYSQKFSSMKTFENQLHLCISKIIFLKNCILLIKNLCQRIKCHCIKDLIFFRILILKGTKSFHMKWSTITNAIASCSMNMHIASHKGFVVSSFALYHQWRSIYMCIVYEFSLYLVCAQGLYFLVSLLTRG